ncbi:LWR-salt protein [Halorubrum sp. 2020YC2]|uniref:LWR-salt protein n=1 Tax=Halorubrum sp. 2020YC2 TaxID=2836432 RepID=UPI001BEA46F1|nr:LWR-salt protein [Halorubrum sp. 2020YC2]QWC18381.1 LWR-salt protein [Halorubrum sp. 2020YC2]
MEAAYVFRVAFRLDPPDAAVDPDRFETTMELPAAEPGTDGWLFFRDRLWRGEIGDEPAFRRLAEARLGLADAGSVEVVAADFRELRTDEAHLDALTESIAADLDRFNADSVDEVLRKYLGSSVHVRE